MVHVTHLVCFGIIVPELPSTLGASSPDEMRMKKALFAMSRTLSRTPLGLHANSLNDRRKLFRGKTVPLQIQRVYESFSLIQAYLRLTLHFALYFVRFGIPFSFDRFPLLFVGALRVPKTKGNRGIGTKQSLLSFFYHSTVLL